jgi:hypothetical protein
MIKRQQINQRAEAQPGRALRQRREEYSRRSRATDRRAVMLGEMIAVKARAVVSLGKPQPAGKQLAVRNARIVHVVEYAEFHGRAFLTENKRRHNTGIALAAGGRRRAGPFKAVGSPRVA